LLFIAMMAISSPLPEVDIGVLSSIERIKRLPSAMDESPLMAIEVIELFVILDF